MLAPVVAEVMEAATVGAAAGQGYRTAEAVVGADAASAVVAAAVWGTLAAEGATPAPGHPEVQLAPLIVVPVAAGTSAVVRLSATSIADRGVATSPADPTDAVRG